MPSNRSGTGRQLTEEEIELAIESQLKGERLTTTAEKLGFSQLSDFYRYRLRDTAFSKRLSDARTQGSELMEDEVRYVADDYHSPHTARVKMESLCRLLAFRDPAKYGNKVDITIAQTVDIGSSLARMQGRLDSTYRDVTPSVIEGETEKPNDFNDLW